jgi:hypothetical protein
MGQVVRRAALGLATAFARYIDNQRKPLRQPTTNKCRMKPSSISRQSHRDN